MKIITILRRVGARLLHGLTAFVDPMTCNLYWIGTSPSASGVK